MTETTALLRRASVVFWDFDGVIKDSVEAKSNGFERLFLPYGKDVAKRVRQHHEANGGVPRDGKLSIYLRWVGEPATDAQVQEFCNRFSGLVLQSVIDSPWVPGVREYLLANHSRQHFVLLTATPQDEIQTIAQTLGIAACFEQIFGSPKKKAAAMPEVLSRLKCSPEEALMVGDSESDLDAAEANGLPFLLRRTNINRALQMRYAGPSFQDLTHG
jgi:phosphoglycolate phosphatase-like HAD superfamily hydrolase